ncbi:MAG: hypothetical protein SO014_08090 [Candidatus Limivicinus sp.]|nr:hypothetical protein [Candidatus Limivicinus sp.]
MEYPLIIDGKRAGKLNVESSGLYTCFEAWTGESDRLLRVWVHGGGRCAYLGVMQPWSGGMYLRRRMSRRESADFPEYIEFASNDGCSEAGTAERESPRSAAEPQRPGADAERKEWNSCPYPAPIAGDSAELQWYRRSDGTLVSHDGISSLIALPAQLRHAPEGAVVSRIGTGQYIIFRY